jgi:hypothetical protein
MLQLLAFGEVSSTRYVLYLTAVSSLKGKLNRLKFRGQTRRRKPVIVSPGTPLPFTRPRERHLTPSGDPLTAASHGLGCRLSTNNVPDTPILSTAGMA